MPLPGNRLTNSDYIRESVFDAKAITNSYAAFDTNAETNHFVVLNYTGVDVSITVAGAGDAVTLKDGFSMTLYGNPSGYQAKRVTGSTSVTLQVIIYK